MKMVYFDLTVEVANATDEFELAKQIQRAWFDYQTTEAGKNLKEVGIQMRQPLSSPEGT